MRGSGVDAITILSVAQNLQLSSPSPDVCQDSC